MSKQPPPAPTASAGGPCPIIIQIVGRPGTGSLPRTIAPPDHPRLTFDQGLSYYDNFKHLLQTTGPIVNKSHLEPPGADGSKICLTL